MGYSINILGTVREDLKGLFYRLEFTPNFLKNNSILFKFDLRYFNIRKKDKLKNYLNAFIDFKHIKKIIYSININLK